MTEVNLVENLPKDKVAAILAKKADFESKPLAPGDNSKIAQKIFKPAVKLAIKAFDDANNLNPEDRVTIRQWMMTLIPRNSSIKSRTYFVKKINEFINKHTSLKRGDVQVEKHNELLAGIPTTRKVALVARTRGIESPMTLAQRKTVIKAIQQAIGVASRAGANYDTETVARAALELGLTVLPQKLSETDRERMIEFISDEVERIPGPGLAPIEVEFEDDFLDRSEFDTVHVLLNQSNKDTIVADFAFKIIPYILSIVETKNVGKDRREDIEKYIRGFIPEYTTDDEWETLSEYVSEMVGKTLFKKINVVHVLEVPIPLSTVIANLVPPKKAQPVEPQKKIQPKTVTYVNPRMTVQQIMADRTGRSRKYLRGTLKAHIKMHRSGDTHVEVTAFDNKVDRFVDFVVNTTNNDWAKFMQYIAAFDKSSPVYKQMDKYRKKFIDAGSNTMMSIFALDYGEVSHDPRYQRYIEEEAVKAGNLPGDKISVYPLKVIKDQDLFQAQMEVIARKCGGDDKLVAFVTDSIVYCFNRDELEERFTIMGDFTNPRTGQRFPNDFVSRVLGRDVAAST